MGKPKVQVFAIVRVDDFLSGDHAIAVTAIVPSWEEAESEVARLAV